MYIHIYILWFIQRSCVYIHIYIYIYLHTYIRIQGSFKDHIPSLSLWTGIGAGSKGHEASPAARGWLGFGSGSSAPLQRRAGAPKSSFQP